MNVRFLDKNFSAFLVVTGAISSFQWLYFALYAS